MHGSGVGATLPGMTTTNDNGEQAERTARIEAWQAAARSEHAAGHEVRLSAMVGSDVEMQRYTVRGWQRLGRLVDAEDYGHDRSLKFKFRDDVDGVVLYLDGYTAVRNGIVREPEHAGWSSD